jgi:magnesium transporter
VGEEQAARSQTASRSTLGAITQTASYSHVGDITKTQERRKVARWGRRPEAGARPGELVLPDEDVPVDVRVFDYGPDSVREWSPTPEELGLTPAGAAVRWVDVQGLGNLDLLQRLAEVFKVHPLALADVVNVGQRAKVDAYEHNHVIILRMVRLCSSEDHGPLNIEYEQVSLLVGPNWVLTVQERTGDVWDPIRNRLRQKLGNVRVMGADYLAYALLDAIVDAYFPVADHLGGQFELLENEIIADGGDRRDLNRIHELRSELREFERPVRQTQALLSTLLNSDQTPISDGVRVWLRDVYDHTLQVREMIDRHRDFATALMELHLSTANNKMNEVMKLLTVISSIFIPLTFIASIYGMNFDHMPELKQWWGYPLILLLMISVATTLITFFRKRDWL